MSEFMKWLRSAPVVWKPLGEVLVFQRGTSITRKTSKEGEYPVISGGQQPAYYVDQYNRTGETITIAGSGAYAGFVMYWNEPIFVGDAFSIKSEDNKVLVRYVFHFLLNIQEQIYALKRGGGVPHVYAKDLSTFEIPIPPMEVQEEIVRILDKFSALTTKLQAELQKELELRRKQYDYYLHHLLTFDPSEVTYKPLNKVTSKVNNIAWESRNEYEYIDLTSVDILSHTITATTTINQSNAPSRAKQVIHHNDILFATTRPTQMRITMIPPEYDGQLASTGYAVLRVESDELIPRFVYFYLSTSYFATYCERNQSGSTYPSISDTLVKAFTIPIPPHSEQERIVGILDKFERLTHSLTEGLPREIELRQKQYEYYRNLLLSFE